jgi:hypothetical protein
MSVWAWIAIGAVCVFAIVVALAIAAYPRDNSF